MDGAKGKPPLSTGKRQVQPISPQLSAARAGAGRPRQPRVPTKRARSDDEPDPEPGPSQVICLSCRLAALCMQHRYLLGIPLNGKLHRQMFSQYTRCLPNTTDYPRCFMLMTTCKSSCASDPQSMITTSHYDLLYMQPVLLPLKKPGGKPEKNFKRPQARANGAPEGRNERAQPGQADPGIERCFHTADRLHKESVQGSLA